MSSGPWTQMSSCCNACKPLRGGDAYFVGGPCVTIVVIKVQARCCLMLQAGVAHNSSPLPTIHF